MQTNIGQYYGGVIDAIIIFFESEKKFREQDFNDVTQQLILFVIDHYCVEHPLFTNTYAPISFIIKDLSKSWSKKQIIHWLKSLKESGAVVKIN